jgi:hypothetical protein
MRSRGTNDELRGAKNRASNRDIDLVHVKVFPLHSTLCIGRGPRASGAPLSFAAERDRLAKEAPVRAQLQASRRRPTLWERPGNRHTGVNRLHPRWRHLDALRPHCSQPLGRNQSPATCSTWGSERNWSFRPKTFRLCSPFPSCLGSTRQIEL